MHGSIPADAHAAWVHLIGQGVLCCILGLCLLLCVPYLPAARPEIGGAWGVALAVHALASLRLFSAASDFLLLECPSCSESFHGLPEQLPRPFRTCCAACGEELTELRVEGP